MSSSCSTLKSDWYYASRDTIDSRINHGNRKWYSFIRDLENGPSAGATKFDYLVEYFADVILGPYDQDISLLLVGNKGRGKSLCAQSICYYTACELALRNGGKWTDYYNPETNMAVILESEANAVMAIQKKYQVKNYDDIGIGWGARNWQDKDNKDKNDVFQINRTDSTLQVFSVPNQFLLDKVPRSLVSHYGEMAQQFFEHGFTTIKLFEPETLFREGKIIQPYLNVDRTKYVLFRIPKPPDDLVSYYKKRRYENKEKATSSRLGEDSGNASEKPAIRKNATTLSMEREMYELSARIMPIIQAGGSDDDIMTMLVNECGFSKTKAKRWVKSSSFQEIYPHT